MTTNADRVYAVLAGGDSTHEKITTEAHPGAPYSRDEADLDCIDYGIAVGAAFVLERLDDPLRSQPDTIAAALSVARTAWQRISTPAGAEVAS